MDLNQLQNFYHVPNTSGKHCYVVNITAEHSIWQSENPLTQALPILALQLSIIIFICRAVYFLLRPLNAPRFVADILGGILLGPTAFRNIRFFTVLFPLRSIMIVETVAYWALTCHLFLVALEMDFLSALRSSSKAIRFAAASVLIPFVAGIGLFFIMNSAQTHYRATGCFFYAVALAITGFPIVARILSDIKLLHSEIGRIAMSTSIINDFIAWILVAIILPFRVSAQNAAFVIISTIGFVLFCTYVVRPVLASIIRNTAGENNDFSDQYLTIILVSVSLFAALSDILGMHSIVGAFVFGLIMPNRMLGAMFLEKFEDFLTGYLLPLFFTVCGIRVDIWRISNWGIAIVVVIMACSVKVLSTLLASNLFDMPRKEAVSLGVLMNTKGILAMVVLNLGLDSAVLNEQDYSVLVIATVLMTVLVPPIMLAIYHPTKRQAKYNRRTIQKSTGHHELRMLTCFHGFNNVPGIINLIDSSNPTRQSPLNLVTIHLVELTGRASTMLIVHNPNKSSIAAQNYSRRNPQSEQIITALQTYGDLNEFVNIHSLTALSPFATMHEDICSLAEDKETAFLILPFHKLPSDEGKLDVETNAAFRGVNVNVMANAPCTVGIFVDKGFGVTMHGESNLTMRKVAMLFIGGPDDREALAYAWRMAGGHGINLTVVRFLPGDQVEEIEPMEVPAGDTHRLITSVSYVDKKKRLDDEYVNEFRLKSAGEDFMSYEEKVVNNEEDLVSALKEMHHVYDLYVVSKGEGIVSPLTAGLADWCEYPELGPLGDLLVTSSFAQGSVLVVQQYSGFKEGNLADIMAESDDSDHGRDRLGNWQRAPSQAVEDGGQLEMEPFARRKSKDDIDV